MFEKPQIDAIFDELKKEWLGKPEYEQLYRDLDLGIAYFDSDRPLQNIDPRAVALIEKHKPS